MKIAHLIVNLQEGVTAFAQKNISGLMIAAGLLLTAPAVNADSMSEPSANASGILFVLAPPDAPKGSFFTVCNARTRETYKVKRVLSGAPEPKEKTVSIPDPLWTKTPGGITLHNVCTGDDDAKDAKRPASSKSVNAKQKRHG